MKHVMFFKYLWAVPFCVGLLVALLSPLNILDYKLPHLVVSVMSEFIPMIGKLNSDYAMTQVTQFYFSTMWLMSPIILMSFIKGEHFDMEKFYATYLKHKSLLTLSVLFFFFLAVWFGIFEGPDINDIYDLRTQATLHNRFGLATYGFLIPSGTALLSAILVILMNCNQSIINKEKTNDH